MSRVLVVEDQHKLRRNLQQLLEQEGYAVEAASTGEEGYYLETTEPFDAIVLDLNLPKRDGSQVLHDLREGGFLQPVLILTARDSIEDRFRRISDGNSRSKLYDWHGDDFTQQVPAVLDYAARFVPKLKESLAAGRTPKIRSIDYDWR